MTKNSNFDMSYGILTTIALALTLTLLPPRSLAQAAQKPSTRLQIKYTVSMSDTANHRFHVDLSLTGMDKDTIWLAMPAWMPGYYQIMRYDKAVTNISATDKDGKSISISKTGDNNWQIFNPKKSALTVAYDVTADKKFVANNYLDSGHGYIISAATFFYIPGQLKVPVTITVISNKNWSQIATGLDPLPGSKNVFSAPDFDVLYDCPILIGNLDELPSFNIYGIKHRFIGYNTGQFDRKEFISTLSKVVKAGVDIICDIPYKQYTFLGIGPGFGGIEHSNNSTVSFSGNRLDKREEMIRMMNFLSHEYFHLYNVKRIRPYELGPFDYSKENRTNLLWESEGFTVYYEYLILKRSGLINMQELFSDIEKSINAFENDPGRFFQSLSEASYNTWSDGPFGNQDPSNDRSISCYDKGAIEGMLLDLAIRNASGNQKSLDDVMKFLYFQYYKKMGRGFTDAEFQQVCESAAGTSLSDIFEYVYTTKQIDYNTSLAYAGLKITKSADQKTGTVNFSLSFSDEATPEQIAVRKSWIGE
jgi:predicted metalloprotease with PDZ domain